MEEFVGLLLLKAIICSIWKQILSIKWAPVFEGRQFELKGHYILSAKIVSP